MNNVQHTLECPHCAGEVLVLLDIHVVTNKIAATPTFDSALRSALDTSIGLDVDPESHKHEDSDTPPVYQACTNCHRRKKKCSPTLPCENCARSGKELECVYPPANERYKRKKFALDSHVSQGAPGPSIGASPEMFRLLPPSANTATHNALIASTAPDLGGPSTQGSLSDIGGLAAAYVPQPPQLLFLPPQPRFGSLEFGPEPFTYSPLPPRRETLTVYDFPFVENGEGVQGDGYPQRFDRFSFP